MLTDKWIVYSLYYPTNWDDMCVSFLSLDYRWHQDLGKAELFDSHEEAERFMKALPYTTLTCPRIDLHPECRYGG